MGTLNNDIKLAELSLQGQGRKEFNFIYTGSNEDLDNLFNMVDVKNQDVLTVLASCDQYFYAYKKKAKSIDTFDINSLTIRYFYLRKWLMKFKENIYHITTKNFQTILNRVVPLSKAEDEALFFWKKVMKMVLKVDDQSEYVSCWKLFEESYNPASQDTYVCKKDLNQLNPRFYHYNIYSDTCINTSKQYDKIFISNIFDYAKKVQAFEQAYKNLDGLLKDNGEVIACSYNLERVKNYHKETNLFNMEPLFNQSGNLVAHYKLVRK